MDVEGVTHRIVGSLMANWESDSPEELDVRLCQCISIMSESENLARELGEYLPEMTKIVKEYAYEPLTQKLMAAMILGGYTLDQVKASFT